MLNYGNELDSLYYIGLSQENEHFKNVFNKGKTQSKESLLTQTSLPYVLSFLLKYMDGMQYQEIMGKY